jgi:GNAT superfamily N-acetyltransferase
MTLQIIRTRHPPEPHIVMVHRMLGEAGVKITLQELRARLEALGKEDRLLLALDGDQVAGYAHLRVMRDLVDGESAEVVTLLVAKQYRRTGVGRRLVAAAETWALESGRARLVLRTDVVRTDAHAFYTAMGYEKSATTLEFVRDLEKVRQADRPTKPPKG